MNTKSVINCLERIMRALFFLLIFHFSTSYAFSQQDSVHVKGTKEEINLPKFNLHAGLAWGKGLGIGTSILATEHWSFEAFYGANPRIIFFLWGVSHPETRYSIATNFHFSHLSPWMISLSVTGVTSDQTVVPNKNPLNYLIITLDGGVMSWEKRGFIFYAKGGIAQPIHKQLSNNNPPYEWDAIILTFDVGISWNFW